VTEQEQRIEIAEFCGWTFHDLPPDHNPEDRAVWVSLHGCACKEPPDYLHDLNAMHDVEQRLTPLQKDDYGRLMRCITANKVTAHTVFGLLHSTASQRVEGVLRILRKWKD
jgi:hypothetical protein